MNKTTATLLVKAAKAIIKADRANVYVNRSDYEFRLWVRTPAFDGLYIRFNPQPDAVLGQEIRETGTESIPLTLTTLKKFGETTPDGKTIVCNGASGASDKPKGVVKSTGLHDPGYLELNRIADEWKDKPYNPGPNFKRDWITNLTSKDSPTWTKEDVRQLLDSMFGDAMRKLGGHWLVVRGYNTGVRVCGGVFHKFTGASVQIIVLASLSVAVSGCTGGCMDPPDILEMPDGGPDIEQTQSGDITGAMTEIVKEGLTQ